MNEYIKTVPFIGEQYPEEYFLLETNGYHTLNEDGLYKWASILQNIKTHKPNKNYKILDVGGGYSAVTFFLSKENEVLNIDLNRNDNWFSTLTDGTISSLKEEYYNINNITFKELNFLTQHEQIPDNYFDIIIDGCSLIHFDPQPLGDIKNKGLYQSAQIIAQKLKQDGIFVASSDLISPNSTETNEWLNPNSYIDCVEKGGLKLVGDKNFMIHENLINVKNYLTVGKFIFKK
jgi:hypothetical protein